MIVLLPHCGFLSETSRMLTIAQALARRGEPFRIATHGGPYAQVLDKAGVPYTLLPPRVDTERFERFLRDLLQIGRPGVRLQPADEVRAAVQAETAFLREHRASVAVTGFTLTAYLSTRLAGIPLVTSHGGSFVAPVFERGLAPAPLQMPIPGTNWLPARFKQWHANASPTRMRGPVRFLNEIAAELRVEPVPSLAALMHGDLTLVTDTAEVLGIPEDTILAWRPPADSLAYRPSTRLAYSGPLFARLDLPIPAPVQARLDGSRPTAYVVLSSSSPRTLRAVTARVRAAGFRVIVGATIHDYGPVDDPQVVVAGILPSDQIMPRVDVVVTMGGQGSVQTAMASGVPLAAIPLHPEQEFNVALAMRQGMAIGVAPRHADTPRMTEAVRRLREEPAWRTAARRVASHYAGIDGADRAAAAILAHAGAARPAAAARRDPDRPPVAHPVVR